MIFCGNTQSLRTHGRTGTHDVSLKSDLHEPEFFQSLHDDGEDDWQERRDKSVRKRRRTTCRALAVADVLIPGAAMVIRETTTWEMPFTAAFYGDPTASRQVRNTF